MNVKIENYNNLGLCSLSYQESLNINGGEKPKDWDQKSTAYKIGYAIGHATIVTFEVVGGFLFPWV